MARFDVHQSREGRGYLLDCQTDYIRGLETRLMVPLFPFEDFSKPVARLNPVFRIEDARVVMMTQYAAAMRTRDLLPKVTWLDAEQDAIMNALDMLLTGY